MNKPIILIREELIDRLKSAINESRLPAFVIAPILADLLNEINMIHQNDLLIAKDEYKVQKKNTTNTSEAADLKAE